MTTTRFTVRFRRKREGRTNYKKRLALLKSRKPRLIIRKTNTQIILQIAQYLPDGDKIIATVQSNELTKHGWKHSFKNLPAAYLAGMLIAKKAKMHKIEGAILDMGLTTPLKGTKIFAALKGAVDAGLQVPVSDSIFPTEERLKGEHISSFLEKHKTITQDFEKIKKEIKG
ncbi:50S ribosomal protein L18 [Candidatus Woesearchaeota archaeon CG10_big_fil_rev_8_21_14_0_10_32_9]|nr:MAG: 50S ribosomal protein L18 [Candidatus Woesearchaeota archaeon CG10_big_fil_rev_8_21_14_0_10_32_9]